MKAKLISKSLIGIALIFVVIGLIFPFFNCNILGAKYDNSEYISALFSLASVMLFCAALMYQLVEYKQQNAEVIKSVQAQIKSSEALDEQRRILLEQNANSLIFGMIENFNSFKERNKTQSIIDKLIDFYQKILARRWQNNMNELNLSRNELNIKFAKDIKEMFSDTIIKHEDYLNFKRYIQFVYNVFYLIDQNKPNMIRDNFTPFFLSQLNTEETIMIYLSNLVDNEMPFYCNLKWSYYTTVEIVEMIKKCSSIHVDYTEIDCNILTEEFIKLKQKCQN